MSKLLQTIFIIFSLTLLTSLVKAQVPNPPSYQVFLTWQANNFFPADYPGKPYAANNSQIIVSAEVVKDNKIIDTSQADFLWYVNNQFFKRGAGLKEILFLIPLGWIGDYSIRVEIQLGKDNFGGGLIIPVVAPQAVIDFPYPTKSFKIGDQITLRTIPYFFDVDNFQDFNFYWKINLELQKQLNNQNPITLTVAKEMANTDWTFKITAGVQNKANFLQMPQESDLILNIIQ